MAWACLLSKPNLLDLAFKIKKIKQNKKLWLRAQTETKRFLACPTCHSLTVMCNLKTSSNIENFQSKYANIESEKSNLFDNYNLNSIDNDRVWTKR